MKQVSGATMQRGLLELDAMIAITIILLVLTYSFVSISQTVYEIKEKTSVANKMSIIALRLTKDQCIGRFVIEGSKLFRKCD